MKQFLLSVAACVCSFWAMGQVTVLSENFDSDSIPALPNGWTTTTNFDIGFRTESSQPSDYAGASGLNNVVMRNTDSTGTYALYSPVFSTVGLIGLQMTFASRVSTNYLTPGSTTPILECSADNGVSWIEISYIENTNNSVWMPVNEGPAIILPIETAESPNVQLRWTLNIVNDPSGSYRMDDVQVFGFPNPISTVTLRVNMANEVVSADGVFVAGNFNGWDATASPMTDLGGGIYEYQTEVSWNSDVMFRFYNGSATSELVPDSCGADDQQGSGQLARLFQIGQSNIAFGPVCFNACGNCVIVDPVYHNVTFNVDMSQQILSGSGVSVAVQVPDSLETLYPMLIDVNGVFSAQISVLESSTINYRFVNGADISAVETVPFACGYDNGSGVLKHELFVGNEDISTALVCFSSCEACVQPFVAETSASEISVYPNPASDKVILKVNGNAGFNYCVVDAMGNTCLSAFCAGNTCTLDVSNLSNGIYRLVTSSGVSALVVGR